MSAQYPPQPRPAPIPQPQLAPSGQTPGSYTEAFRGREAHTKFADPCEIARQESMRCLNDNSYDKGKCTEVRCPAAADLTSSKQCAPSLPLDDVGWSTDVLQQYRDCKKTWLDQRREDRRAGKDVA
ncbi:Cytochrome c oxidase-assembly factor COX23, mitochondrial [Rhodotorula toruloides]|nr:Cytochrome c oxidase-assembly factor COX23, mitochondrial [Rhodotorula toruloides]